MSDSKSAYDSLFAAASTQENFRVKGDNESDQEFLHRLADIISSVPDEYWAALTEEARQWYDDCIEGEELKNELALPQGYPHGAPPVEQFRRRPRAVSEKVPTVYEQLLFYVRKANPDVAEKHPRQSDQAYLSRLLRDIGEEVPTGISQWIEQADEALEKNTAIPLPEGYPVTEPVVEKARPQKVKLESVEPVVEKSVAPPKVSAIDEYHRKLQAGEIPLRRQRTAAPPKQSKTPKPKVAAGRMGRIARDDSTTALIRDAVSEAFEQGREISIQDLTNMLHARGRTEVSAMTITTTRASHIAALRSVQRRGWLPPSHGIASAAD